MMETFIFEMFLPLNEECLMSCMFCFFGVVFFKKLIAFTLIQKCNSFDEGHSFDGDDKLR